jgi:hypothetical protein
MVHNLYVVGVNANSGIVNAEKLNPLTLEYCTGIPLNIFVFSGI